MKHMKICIVLLALLMATMAMVPMVSAEEKSRVEEIRTIQPVIDPNYNPVEYGIADEPPFAKVTVNPNDNKGQIEFVYVLVSKEWLKTNGLTDKNDSVTFSVPSNQVHFVTNKAGTPAHVPTDFLSESAALADDSISVLWAPTNVVHIQKKSDFVTITCPHTLLLNFKNMKETESTLQSAKSENLQIPEVPLDSATDQLKLKKSLLASANPAERKYYTDYFNLHSINGATGMMQPASYSNSGESFTSYHEIELYLQQSTDAVEYIVYQRSDGRVIEFVSVHDDYVLSSPLTMDVTGLSTYMEWYFYIESGPVWYMHFRNPISGTWYSAWHTDTVNLSNRITKITPSTELTLNVPPVDYFYTLTSPFRVDWTRTAGLSGNEWHYPIDTTSAGSNPTNYQYVQLTSNWDSSGRIVSSQACGSSVG
ncbi:MAG: hypothetical protein Q7T80_01285 [Methanoregula sp.]|nr:hypothetical protein [Methanoregula sp.]